MAPLAATAGRRRRAPLPDQVQRRLQIPPRLGVAGLDGQRRAKLRDRLVEPPGLGEQGAQVVAAGGVGRRQRHRAATLLDGAGQVAALREQATQVHPGEQELGVLGDRALEGALRGGQVAQPLARETEVVQGLRVVSPRGRRPRNAPAAWAAHRHGGGDPQVVEHLWDARAARHGARQASGCPARRQPGAGAQQAGAQRQHGEHPRRFAPAPAAASTSSAIPQTRTM